MNGENSQSLIQRFQAGDDQAAALIFDRYVARLLNLARRKLSPKLQAKVDPEDIVQSAYRSFFGGVKEGRFDFRQSGDLWKLLAAITVNKLLKRVEYWQAAKRNPQDELSLQHAYDSDGRPMLLDNHEPGPAEVALITEEIEQVMRNLESAQRLMFEMWLQGHSIKEIGLAVNRSEFSARRLINKVRQSLRDRLQETEQPDE